MKIGWLSDNPPIKGGAEYAAEELIRTKPEDVEIIPCPPHDIASDVDVYVVHNCVEYTWKAWAALSQKPVVKYVHDVWPNGDVNLRTLLCQHAHTMIFSSPLHRESVRFRVACPVRFVPNPMNLTPFFEADKASGERKAACWIGRFDIGKGIPDAERWSSNNNTPIDFYGYGYLLEHVTKTGRYKGQLDYAQVPAVMAQYARFVLLPIHCEPFGRTVVEAWAAGCELVINGNVGAAWWIENYPDLLTQGSDLFWRMVNQAV